MYVYVVSYEIISAGVIDSVFDTKEKAIKFCKKRIEDHCGGNSDLQMKESAFGGFIEFYVNDKDGRRLITYQVTTRYVY